MKTTAFMKIVAITGMCVCTMSACTTVDLSQVTFDTKPVTKLAEVENVVERASASMMALFEKKGWCKTDLREKTQTAASVLLNGLDFVFQKKARSQDSVVNAQKLSDDIYLANSKVELVAQAAHVYLSTRDVSVDLGVELTLLESALVTAREAEIKFGEILALNNSDHNQREYDQFQTSIDDLKIITDIYGVRMRQQIMSRANTEHS